MISLGTVTFRGPDGQQTIAELWSNGRWKCSIKEVQQLLNIQFTLKDCTPDLGQLGAYTVKQAAEFLRGVASIPNLSRDRGDSSRQPIY